MFINYKKAEIVNLNNVTIVWSVSIQSSTSFPNTFYHSSNMSLYK